jgi:uncharacterized membrane protein HdeD (DUF308 family)
MDKFFEWTSRNRKSIGYTIGALNLLAGISNLVNNNYTLAVVNLVIAVVLIADAWRTK